MKQDLNWDNREKPISSQHGTLNNGAKTPRQAQPRTTRCFTIVETKQHCKLPGEPRTGSRLPAEESGAPYSALPTAFGASPGLPGAGGKLLLGVRDSAGTGGPGDRGCGATASSQGLGSLYN